MTFSFKSTSSLRLCKSKSVVSKIKFCVIRSDEYITKDPQRSTWWWDIDSHETTQTDCFAKLRDLETNNLVSLFKNRKAHYVRTLHCTLLTQNQFQIAYYPGGHWGFADSGYRPIFGAEMRKLNIISADCGNLLNCCGMRIFLEN